MLRYLFTDYSLQTVVSVGNNDNVPVKRLLGEERASERVSPARAEEWEDTFNWLVHGTLLAGH